MKIFGVFVSAFALLAVSAGAADKPFKVGLVLDRGGKDDKSFNAIAYLGATDAEKKLGVQLKTVESSDNNAFEPNLRNFAQKDFDLIIGIGFAQMDAVKKVATQFPKKNFAIVDAEVNLPNVRSLLFEEHEGSFLVGAIAAMTSKSKNVGFIGGMDIPLIRRFEKGFEAGAKAVDGKVGVKVNYIGVTSEAWSNPAKAKELALSQYNSGVDVIFHAAGASGTGLFDAAEEKKKFAIGVDSNQNWVKPGVVLTSMLKRGDVAVFKTIEDAKAGKFKGGVVRYGLGNDGVGYALDKNNESVLPAAIRTKADGFKKDIVAGKIQVPDYYKSKSGS